MFTVASSGDVEHFGDYQNGLGFAMPIWTYLAEKYLRKPGEKDHEFFGRWWIQDNCRGVWALENDKRMERFERVVLLASFDRVIVRAENFKELAAAFDKFHDLYLEKKPQNVCHYRAMGREIEKMEDVLGVCWVATSVGENLWTVYEDCECPKCKNVHQQEEPRPYNINIDNKHWFLFEELEKWETAQKEKSP